MAMPAGGTGRAVLVLCGLVLALASPEATSAPVAPAPVAAAPWLASVFGVETNGVLKYLCSGVLVSRGVIVTPARCLFDEKTKKPVKIEPSLKVLLGRQTVDGLLDDAPKLASVDRIVANPEWSGNVSDVAIAVLKHCQDPAAIAQLNNDPQAEVYLRALSVLSYAPASCNAGPLALKSVSVDIMSKRNADCDKATEFQADKVYDGGFCAQVPPNPKSLLCEADVGGVAVGASGSVVGLYLNVFSFTSLRAQAEWIRQNIAFDICPKQPISATPAPTTADPGPSIISPIYIGDSNEPGTKLRGSIEAAQRAAVNIITEAQVKGRLVYINAVKRAMRGGPSQSQPAAPASAALDGLPVYSPAQGNVLEVAPFNPNCPTAKCPQNWPTPAPTEADILETELPKPQHELILWHQLGLHKKLEIDPVALKRTEKLLHKLRDFHRKNVKVYEMTCDGPTCPLSV